MRQEVADSFHHENCRGGVVSRQHPRRFGNVGGGRLGHDPSDREFVSRGDQRGSLYPHHDVTFSHALPFVRIAMPIGRRCRGAMLGKRLVSPNERTLANGANPLASLPHRLSWRGDTEVAAPHSHERRGDRWQGAHRPMRRAVWLSAVGSGKRQCFVSAPPRWAPATIVGWLKGYISRRLRERFPKRKRLCGKEQLWTPSD